MNEHSAQSLALAVGVSSLVMVICRKVKVPALLPLLAIGVGLGTSGAGLIDGGSLGDGLRGIVTVSIGLLIFEGALHLNREELSHTPRAVWGLLTVGALTTWLGSAAAAYWILGMSLPIAAILGAALIVTGPTVVQPILRLMRVSPRLHTALGAEAVLIDPIGVVATVATLEVVRVYLQTGAGVSMAEHGFWLFLKPLVAGAGVGTVAGFLGQMLLRLLNRQARPDPQVLNLLAVGLCMACVGVGESIAPEAGLSAVTVCGVLMARTRVLGATELRSFKELLATILVGTLFLLLSSRFDAAQFSAITWREVLFVVALLVLVRPACVLVSTWKSTLSWRERAFASVFAPRGIVALSVVAIVAADIASLESFGSSESATPITQQAARLEPVMFVTIVGTVLAASTLSPLMAWLLRVRAGRGNAIILVGGHALSFEFARVLMSHAVHVRIIDRNPSRVARADQGGFDAIAGDATDTRWLDDAGAPHDAGWVLAWTGNDDVDQVAARWGIERYGPGHAFLWSDKPARTPLNELDIGAGEPLSLILSRFESHHAQIADVADPSDLDRVLGWIDNGILTLAGPGVPPPRSGTRRVIGIRMARESSIILDDVHPQQSPASASDTGSHS